NILSCPHECISLICFFPLLETKTTAAAISSLSHKTIARLHPSTCELPPSRPAANDPQPPSHVVAILLSSGEATSLLRRVGSCGGELIAASLRNLVPPSPEITETSQQSSAGNKTGVFQFRLAATIPFLASSTHAQCLLANYHQFCTLCALLNVVSLLVVGLNHQEIMQ
ncbi:hypothetical protein Droror1_Dr00024178, partial [Drosera rotundifolia]